MIRFSIGEIARRAGVAASAIRYYERIGLLPPPARVSGKRRYDLSILGTLALIWAAQAAGFSLVEIDALLYGFPADMPPGERWLSFADRKIAELEAAIEQAHRQKAFLETVRDCHCPTLDHCAAELSVRLPDLRL